MTRLESRLKLALPLAAVVAATVLFAPQCSREDEQKAASGSARERTPQEEQEIDPDKWSAAFSRQLSAPEELTEDASVTRGTLNNGFRYVVMEHPGEAGRVSLRLLVKAGSMHEEESERGFAHFVEHMAFQGTSSLPDHSMPIFERLGLRSGADTNAWTACDCTAYKLDMPDADEKALETAFKFLRDVTDGILFLPGEVESERQIILREMEEREAKNPVGDLRLATILPEVHAARRAPIGLRRVIEKATTAQLRSFWQRNYVPSRMTLIAVGDFKQRELIARIASHFSSLSAREAPPEPRGGDPLAGEDVTIDCLPCPGEAGRVGLAIAAPQPEDVEPDSLTKRREGFAMALSSRMISSRLRGTALAAKVESLSHYTSYNPLTPRFGWLEASAETKKASLLPALEHLAREWRRARDTGFNDLEFAEARSELRTRARMRFSSRLSRSVVSAASILTRDIQYGLVYESPEDELNRSRAFLSTITRAECEELTREWWSRKVLRILISGDVPERLEDDAEKTVRKAWGKPAAPAAAGGKVRELTIEPFGPAGRIIRKRVDRDRSFLEVEFENHVFARLKPLPGLGGCVTASVHAGFGPLAIPLENPGLGTAANLLVSWNPLPGWSGTQLRAGLSNTEASMDFSLNAVPACTFQWKGDTDRSSLRRQLELLCAAIAHPGIATLPSPWKPTRDLRILAEMGHLYGERELETYITGGDPRFRPQAEAFLRTDSDQVKEWLLPIMRNSRLCVIIAGDFAPQEALSSLARTFGALPDREVWSNESPYPAIALPEPGVTGKRGKSPQGYASLLLPRDAARSPNEAWQLHLLTEVTELRMRAVIRESLGESYSPNAQLWSSPGLPGGWIVCKAPCSDNHSERTGESLRGVIQSLRQNGWSEDEYLRAARPLVSSLRTGARTPDYWLWTLIDPETSSIPGKGDLSTLKAMEPEVKGLMHRLFDPAVFRELRVEPEEEASRERNEAARK